MLANGYHYFYIIQSVTNPISFVNDTFEKPGREEISFASLVMIRLWAMEVEKFSKIRPNMKRGGAK